MTPDQDPSTLPQKNKSKDHCEARVFKFIAFAALVLLLYLINVLDPTFYGHVFHLVKGGDMEEAVCFLRSYGPWAIVISFFLDVFINAAGFLPSIFMSTANGVVFGLPIGITISWAAESVGVIISFLIMRYFLRATAEKVIIKSNNLKKQRPGGHGPGQDSALFSVGDSYLPGGHQPDEPAGLCDCHFSRKISLHLFGSGGGPRYRQLS